jgi:excinuclease ABC subunit B
MDNRPLTVRGVRGDRAAGALRLATPGPYELERVGGEVAEQVIRPTGLLDPPIEVKPAQGQVPDLLEQCRASCSAASACWSPRSPSGCART